MDRDSKKIAAATLGVFQYLWAEKEKAKEAGRSSFETALTPKTSKSLSQRNSWAANGRMSMMEMRNLLQYRAFRRSQKK
jgi:hypothetical protein